MAAIVPIGATIVASGIATGTVLLANSYKLRRTQTETSILRANLKSGRGSARDRTSRPPEFSSALSGSGPYDNGPQLSPIHDSSRRTNISGRREIESTIRYAPQDGPYAARDSDASSVAHGEMITMEDADAIAVAKERSTFSPLGLLCTPFVLSQIAFNIVASFAPPLLCFWLIFGGGGPYSWLSGEVLGPITASPLAGCVAALAFLPLSMPEMVERGWYGVVRPADVHCLSRALPFLRSDKVWRFGVVRHLTLGAILSVLFIPPAVILVSPVVLGPQISAWTLIWIASTFVTTLPLCFIPLGLLAFAIEPNYDRVDRLMARDASRPLHQLIMRAWMAPRC